MKILHIAKPHKFSIPFFRFVERHLDASQHVILTRRRKNSWPADMRITSHAVSGLRWMLAFARMAKDAEKIMLHGLLDFRVVLVLALQPQLLKKCHWFIWGGDLYRYNASSKGPGWHLKEAFRRPVIRQMGHLVTYIDGDVALARQWYGATGQYHECLLYPSNLYHAPTVPPAIGSSVINLQIGNSANPSNNHAEVFDILRPFRNTAIRIHAPLSYGNTRHALKVAEEGQARFGDKFVAMTAFLPFDEYLEFLAKIDIAVFNHDRQQAMGNTITLLGLGKKVYIRENASPWHLFQRLGITVYSVSEFNLDPMPASTREANVQRVSEFFSEQTLKHQLRQIFEES